MFRFTQQSITEATQAVFMEGFNAFHYPDGILVNPYLPDTSNHYYWDMGWGYARETWKQQALIAEAKAKEDARLKAEREAYKDRLREQRRAKQLRNKQNREARAAQNRERVHRKK